MWEEFPPISTEVYEDGLAGRDAAIRVGPAESGS